jgi:hypothetical protein
MAAATQTTGMAAATATPTMAAATATTAMAKTTAMAATTVSLSEFFSRRVSLIYRMKFFQFGEVISHIISKDEARRIAADNRQPKFLEWRLARLDGAGLDTPWYIGLGPHDAPAPVEVAKHC